MFVENQLNRETIKIVLIIVELVGISIICKAIKRQMASRFICTELHATVK